MTAARRWEYAELGFFTYFSDPNTRVDGWVVRTPAETRWTIGPYDGFEVLNELGAEGWHDRFREHNLLRWPPLSDQAWFQDGLRRELARRSLPGPGPGQMSTPRFDFHYLERPATDG